MRWLDSITDSWDINLSKLWETVFWPGEFHGLYSPWGRKELDTTEELSLGDSEGQGRLVCCSLLGCKVLGMT